MSLYSYQRDEALIPLVVVDSHAVVECDRWSDYPVDSYDGIIVLTVDDIKNGSDAFALTFVHLQKRSSYLVGQKILEKVTLTADHVRLQIEVLARQLLIDAREFVLHGHKMRDHESYLIRANDRLAVGYEYIGTSYKYDITAHRSRNDLMKNLLAIVQEVDRISV